MSQREFGIRPSPRVTGIRGVTRVDEKPTHTPHGAPQNGLFALMSGSGLGLGLGLGLGIGLGLG